MGKVIHLNARSGRKAGWWEYRDVIAAGKPFRTCGALSGGPVTADDFPLTFGRLDSKYAVPLMFAVYVIWSYETPIAWLSHYSDADVWYVPDEHYSATTTAHQNKIHVAIAEHVKLWGGRVVR